MNLRFASKPWHLVAPVLVIVCTTGPIRAQSAEPPSETTPDAELTPRQRQYRKAHAEGVKGNWHEARRLLLELWKQEPTPDVAELLGQAEGQLKQFAQSARYLTFSIEKLPPQASSKTLQRRQEKLEWVKQFVGTARIVVSEPSAEVRVDGEAIGTSPLASDVFLDVGNHLIEARLGERVATRSINVEAGKHYAIELPIDGAPPSANGGFAVPIGAGPTEQHGHEHRTQNQTSVQQPNWTPVYVSGGIAAVALAVGVGFAVDASNAKSDGEAELQNATAQFGANPCSPNRGGNSELCGTIRDLQDRRNSSDTVSRVSLVISGVAAATAIGSYFLWVRPRRESPAAAQVRGWVSPTSGGLQFNGSF